MKVMLVVTSLMGAGHLARTLMIAQALREAGAAPVVVTGGREIGHLGAMGVRVEHLPPLWSDGVDYSRLLTPAGPVSAPYLQARADRLVALFEEIAPDALVTELFPFGRRALAGEFTALLERAHGRARIYASIRDVLEPKRKPGRAEETAARLARHYDAVLVHGDERLIDLSATFPLAESLGPMVLHTGYVAAPAPPPEPSSAGEIMVAVGGGVIGRALLEAAIGAARFSARRWRLRVGGADAVEQAARLQALAAGSAVIVEPAAADYRARLGAAACSVSLLGYNTATDLLSAGTPAVIRPMDEGGEREQIIRAEAFAALPGFHLLTKDDPGALTAAVERALTSPGPPRGLVDLGGAARTARLIIERGAPLRGG